MSTATDKYPASDKQIEFIYGLLDKRDLRADPEYARTLEVFEGGDAEFIDFIKVRVGIPSDKSKPRVGSRRASQIIDRLKDLPMKSRETTATYAEGAEPDAGMYRLVDKTIVRVYLGQNSGKMLAKKLVDTGQPDPDDAAVNIHEWEYMGKATRFIKADTPKLTIEEAAEYGRMTGTCCCCGKRLDVPESVERGIGPVCAGRLEVG